MDFDKKCCNDDKEIVKNALEKIKHDQKHKPQCCCPAQITGPTGPTGPTGATARCNKSSIYFFKW